MNSVNPCRSPTSHLGGHKTDHFNGSRLRSMQPGINDKTCVRKCRASKDKNNKSNKEIKDSRNKTNVNKKGTKNRKKKSRFSTNGILINLYPRKTGSLF